MKYSENLMKHAENVVRETDMRNGAAINTAMRSIAWDIESLMSLESIDYEALSKLNQLYAGLNNIQAARKL